MSTPVITFFNNKGGVGKTTLVYHLAWMFAELGKKVVVVDLDPQANLTAAFLAEDDLVAVWEDTQSANTIERAISPLAQVGDLLDPQLLPVGPGIALIAGDIALSGFEDVLSEAWPASMGEKNLFRPFRILTAFWQVAQRGAAQTGADLIVTDVGPHLGAINRSALIGTDYVVIPLGADLFSLQGLQNLGPTLNAWKAQWRKRVQNWVPPEFELPGGAMEPLGYVVQQHGVRLSRPVKAYDRWINRMPQTYHRDVLNDAAAPATPAEDPQCLATMRHYRSLVPMAQEARKPIFKLTPADGAIGNHAQAVQDARADYKRLAEVILERMAARSAARLS